MSKSKSTTLLAPQFDDITEAKYCKKMTLKAAVGKQECMVYCDTQGLVEVKPPKITKVHVNTKTSYCASEVYMKVKEDKSERYVSLDYFTADKIENVFNEKLYIKKSQYRNSYSYRYREPDSSMVEAIKIKAVEVQFPFSNATKLTAETIKKEYNDHLADKVWKIKDDKFRLKEIRNLAILTVGDPVCYGNSTYKVVEILLDEDDASLKVEPIFGGAKLNIELRRTTIYQVPYWTYQKNEIAQLDEELNEKQLLPYLMNDRNCTYNLYWQPIEDAAQYIVTVYKFIELGTYYGRLYELQKVVVDRSTRYFVADKLLGETYIFRVAAEDREGNTIAQSRGIHQNRHVPQNWDSRN